MVIILKANKVNLFVSSVLFVFRYHSPNHVRLCPVRAAGAASRSAARRLFVYGPKMGWNV
jgi:hypothetical protein